jgi:hypothetical protein
MLRSMTRPTTDFTDSLRESCITDPGHDGITTHEIQSKKQA